MILSLVPNDHSNLSFVLPASLDETVAAIDKPSWRAIENPLTPNTCFAMDTYCNKTIHQQHNSSQGISHMKRWEKKLRLKRGRSPRGTSLEVPQDVPTMPVPTCNASLHAVVHEFRPYNLLDRSPILHPFDQGG